MKYVQNAGLRGAAHICWSLSWRGSYNSVVVTHLLTHLSQFDVSVHDEETIWPWNPVLALNLA